MKKYILIAVFILVTLQGVTQEYDVIFSGKFHNLSFSEFVRAVEQETGARIYYLNDWIKSIKISISGEKISLYKTLSNALLPAGLYVYIGADLQVYITPEQPILCTLPDYSGEYTSKDIMPGGEMEKGLTNTEQRYIEGRKAGVRETIIVGTGTENNTRSGVIIHGKMVDHETGESLIGATMYVQELKKGTVTDVNGHYNIVLQPGKYTVDFSCMGMETQQYYLDVRSGGILDIFMAKSLIPISEVVVEANRFHNVKSTQMGFERLNYLMIKEIPLVLGEKDILKVALMLPGVQNVGEGSAGFNVRGSGADQNMIYLNRVPVYNSSHLFGFFSSLNPDIIKDFSIYKSNLPVNFGGRLASFFDISTRQGNMNKYTAHGGINPVTGHIAIEGPVIKNKSAFVLSARSTYSDWILKRLKDPELRNSDASFYDLAGTLTFESNENNLLKTFGYISKDKFTLGLSNKYEYANAGGSVYFKHRFNSRISGDLAVVFGEYAFKTIDKTVTSYAYMHNYRIDHFEIKLDFTYLSLGTRTHKLNFGSNTIYYRLNRGIVKPYGDLSLKLPVNLGIEDGVEAAIYIADEVSITSRFSLYGGIRFSNFMAFGPANVLGFEKGMPKTRNNIIDTLQFESGQIIKRYSALEPRIALNYLLSSNNSVKLSYNRMKQFLFMLSNTIAISPTDQWKLCDYHILPPYADQVSVGYYHDFPKKGFITSMEMYYKWISNVVEYKDGASFINNPNIELETLQGKQKAYGFEIMLRKNTGNLNGWLSYCYSRSFMTVKGNNQGESINNGLTYPSNYDRPHNLNLVINYKMNRRLSISANIVYITGRPVTYPISIYYMDNIKYVYFSERNKYRIPNYFRMDFSFNLEGNLIRKKLAHSYWMLNFYNLTGRENAYSVYFTYEEGKINGYKLSIFARPIITLSWNFKLGNYASE